MSSDKNFFGAWFGIFCINILMLMVDAASNGEPANLEGALAVIKIDPAGLFFRALGTWFAFLTIAYLVVAILKIKNQRITKILVLCLVLSLMMIFNNME